MTTWTIPDAHVMPKHPGVQRLRKATACEGWKCGQSEKARREGYARGCRNNAWWRFRWLNGRAMDLCWPHLIYQGIYGDPNEERRTLRWVEKLEAKG